SSDEARKIREHNFELILNVTSQGPFINVSFDKSAFFQEMVFQVLNSNGEFGETNKNKNKNAFIEYSSPNIAKPIGVGHLRSTIIGESLSRIYEATGFDVKRVNYLGDWGTQFGQLKVSYEKWGDREKIKQNPLKELKDLYVKFQEKAKEEKSLNQEARKEFQKLEQGNKEAKEMWRQFREWSIQGFKKVYKRLGVEFDEYSGESFAAEQAKKEIKKCLDNEIAEKNDDGSIGTSFDNLPSTVLQKEDGSTLYLTRDLATLKRRVEECNIDSLLYVVDARQSLHFQQLFTMAQKLGYLENIEAKHIKFGLLMVDGSPMSTREGTLIQLEELLKKSTDKAKKIISEKNPELNSKKKEEVAESVGIGAIIYNDLKQDRTKNVEFNWDRMLNFEEGSGPYLQYAHARAKSLMAKSNFNENEIVKFDKEYFDYSKDVSLDLAKEIMWFPEKVQSAQKNDTPHIIANFLDNVASKFNSFYAKAPVLNAENESLKKSRLALVKATSEVLSKGLYLLNIDAPDQM
ncbi:MAG: arginine--tRNA ligase, partial [Candidatus Magasanikbacteria bacterium]